MAKVTLIFAVLLIALGLAGYIGTGGVHPTSLIPSYFGLALGIFGFLAISPNESRRKLYMHVNVSIGLLGFLGGAIEAVRGYVHAVSLGLEPNAFALTSKLALAGLMFIYILLCVRSFINARISGKV
jgi:predicted membrane-bound spermidine synthase